MKIRCFIAINLPAEIKKHLGDLINDLKQNNSDKNIKWVDPEGIHLTLHFLGYLDEEKIELVKKIIEENIVDTKPIKIELKDFDGFPNLNQSRVLFISGEEKTVLLARLRLKIGQALEKIAIEIDKRPWQIHFTLARLKIPSKIKISRLKIDNLQFTINSIDLMKSDLSPQGAKYSIMKKFNL